MKGATGFTLLVVVLVIIGLASSCSSSNHKSSADAQFSDDAGLTQDTTPTYEDVWNSRRATSAKLCGLYGEMVNQGWTSDQIYHELDIRGSQLSQDAFYSLIKWCTENDY